MTEPFDGPWWDWAAELRALALARRWNHEAATRRDAQLRAELDEARAAGLVERQRRRELRLAARARERQEQEAS